MKYVKKYDEDEAFESPPVWGAWVEIIHQVFQRFGDLVAPRVGGVG